MSRKVPIFDESCVNQQDVIIYGASTWGELAFRALQTLNIMPSFFCDRAAAGKVKFETPVIAPEDLKAHKEASILIASADFFNEMRAFLDSIGHTNCYSIEWLLQRQISRGSLSKRALEMLDNIYLYEEAACHIDGELSIVHLGFAVTERCTLRCRDCSFLIPYYSDPQDIDLVKYKPAFDKFLSVIDRVSELRLYGGEPFLNKDMYQMIDWYAENEKIRHITIYTNGTVLPTQDIIDRLKMPKVKVHISDYGINKMKTEKVNAELCKNGVSCFVRDYDEWQLGGDLKKRGFTIDEKITAYKKCFMTNCYSFLKGRLYGCPRAAHGINMGATPDYSSDYVDFNEAKDDKSWRAELASLMHELEYLESCDHCNGFDNKAKGVKAGIQKEVSSR